MVCAIMRVCVWGGVHVACAEAAIHQCYDSNGWSPGATYGARQVVFDAVQAVVTITGCHVRCQAGGRRCSASICGDHRVPRTMPGDRRCGARSCGDHRVPRAVPGM